MSTLLIGLVLPTKHWRRYGKIDPTLEQERVALIIATISMFLLVVIQKSEK